MKARTLALLMAASMAACGGDDGSAATTMASASSSLTGFMGGTVTGTATFVENAAGTAADSVTLTLALSGCISGKAYPVHIHTGGDCTDATTQGGHWDTTRGEGIPDVMCTLATGHTATGSATYNRAPTDATLAWTVGDGAATDVIGHTVVVHDPDSPTTRISCGVITAQ